LVHQGNAEEWVMANPFLFQNFLNNLNAVTNGSLSNPNFYEVPKNYVPHTEEPLTKESAKRAIEYLENQTDKKIKISPDAMSGGGGFFNPTEKGGGLYNSPAEANQRTVFLGPTAGLHVLIHEVGHARDPKLRQSMAKEKQFSPEIINSLPTPSQRLQYFADTRITPRTQAEVEAQAYSGFQLPRFAASNPDLNVKAQKIFGDPYFKEYPASYIQQGLDNFYSVETGIPFVQSAGVTEALPGQVATRVLTPNTGYNALKLALNEELQQTEKEIVNKNLAEIEARLNPYQLIPTPLRKDYRQ